MCVYSAELRIAQACPDAPALDVLVDDHIPTKWTNLAFRTVSHYIHLPAGSYNFKVVPTGKRMPVYLNVNQTFQSTPLDPFTIAIASTLSNIKSFVFSDDKQRPKRGHSAFRFVHLSPDAPALDVRFDGDMHPTFTNVAFGSATQYVDMLHGDMTVQLLATGTAHVLAEQDIRFLQDVPTTVYAEGTVAGKNLMVVVSRDL